MTTTLYSLVEQARAILSGRTGETNRRMGLHFQDMMEYAKQIFGEQIRINLFQGMTEGDHSVDGSFVFTFRDQEVLFDEGLALYYTNLPSSTITLPNEAGIDFVSLMKSQTLPFTKVPRNFLAASQGLRIANLEGRSGYWQEGNRIYYVNLQPIPPAKVLIKLVCGVSDVDETTPLRMPFDIQKLIVDKLIERFATMIQLPADETNNNSTQS